MFYRVALIGDLPDYSEYDVDTIECKINHIIDILRFQYGSNLVISLAGHPYIGLLAAKKCLKDSIKYHIFMPCSIDQLDKVFRDDQYTDLKSVFKSAWSVTISSFKYTTRDTLYDKNYKSLVDNSLFVVCLWSGRKQGGAYDAMSYAFSSSKLVIDGLNDLKLMTGAEIY